MVLLSKLMTSFNLQIFELLVDNSFSVRDLAKEINCSPAKITQFVKLFQKEDIIRLKPDKNKKIVGLNRDNPLTREIISLVFIKKILAAKTFFKLKKTAKSIGVYGSVVEGTLDKHSDVDLWILSEKRSSFVDSAQVRASFSKELGREANLKLLTPESLKKLKKNDQIFFNELEYKSKILHGEKLG